MANAPERPPSSVVDYEAWKRGYTPPSEHILIDQLAYRGARVVMSSDWGEELGAIWVVVRGRTLDRIARNQLRELIGRAFPDEPSAPYEYETPDC